MLCFQTLADAEDIENVLSQGKIWREKVLAITVLFLIKKILQTFYVLR